MKSSQTCKELVDSILAQRAGPFSPISKLFTPHLDELRERTGLKDGTLTEVVFNAQHQLFGRGKCLICSGDTKLYPARGGWAKYCSKTCMNDASSERHLASEKTKATRGTGIGNKTTRKKATATYLQRYGVVNPSQSVDVQQKREGTFMEKFGQTTPWKDPTVKLKIAETLERKYGGSGKASPEISARINQTVRADILQNIKSKLSDWEVLDETLSMGLHEQKIQLKHECGTLVQRYAWTGQHLFQPLCPKCHGSSKEQKKVVEFVESLGFETKLNDRSLIKPLELDVLIPSEKIAIEINGVFFHGERYGKDRLYHLNKTEKCAEMGVRLLHYSDVEINERWAAVSHSIKSKLGVLEKINARDCELRPIHSKVSAEFLSLYHLQGACRSSVQFGLFHARELVAVMTFGKTRFSKAFDFELLRFAASKSIRGGASKLLKQFKTQNTGKTLISYADRRWSDGGMYGALGFTFIGASSPGYWYQKDAKIFHRSLFQRHKLGDESNDTEANIMKNRGYDRIWDCGSLKFSLTL